MNTVDAWPAGKTWVFHGTVAEDATGGTHVSSLTVVPGAGNEMWFLYGRVLEGNTATSQTTLVFIDDGTNVLTRILLGGADVGALQEHSFPTGAQISPAATTNSQSGTTGMYLVSGTTRLVLQVTTTAVSVTQAFAVVARIKGGVPTATLADTVGTPVLTTNTNKVF